MGAWTHNPWPHVDTADDWAKIHLAPFLGEDIVQRAREDCDRVRGAGRDGRWRVLLRCADELFGRVSGICARNYSFRRGLASAADAKRGVEVFAARFVEKGIQVWLPIACDGTDGIHACYQRNGAGVPGRFWHRAPLYQWKAPYWLLAGVGSLPPREAGPRGMPLRQEPDVLKFFASRFGERLKSELERAESDWRMRAAMGRLPVAVSTGSAPSQPRRTARTRQPGARQAWERQHRQKLDAVFAAGPLSLEQTCLELDGAGIPPPWQSPDQGAKNWAALYADKALRPRLSVCFSRLRKRRSSLLPAELKPLLAPAPRAGV